MISICSINMLLKIRKIVIFFQCSNQLSRGVPEVVTGSVLLKKVSLKISQISWENTCSGASFKLQRPKGLKARNFIKKRLQHRFFLNIAKFLRTPIFKNIEQLLLVLKIIFAVMHVF